MIRFGMIGTGKISEEFIKGMKKVKDANISSIYSRTEERGHEFAQKFSIPHVFTSLEDMADSKAIDAVYIASPNEAHRSQVIFFLKKGIPVLCEKPLVTSLKDFDEILKTAKENNTLFMEAMKTTLMPNFQVIKDNIKRIAPIRNFFGNFSQYSSRYDLLKEGERTQIFDPTHGGSSLDIGIYPLEFTLALFGNPQSFLGNTLKLDHGVDLSGNILLNYEGMMVSLLHSKIFNSFIPSEIHGENGSIVIGKLSTLQGITLYHRDGTSEGIDVFQEPESMKYEIEEFISLIQNKKKESSINTHELSRKALEILTSLR